MSADVQSLSTYRPYCLACGWWGLQYATADAAVAAADEHDELPHITDAS